MVTEVPSNSARSFNPFPRESMTGRNQPRKSDPFNELLRALRAEPRLVLVSYAFGLLGALFSVHDYHHYHELSFGYSTPLLGAAILLYLFGSRGRR